MVMSRIASLASRLFSADGRQVQARDLKTPQTAELASLHQEFATHPTRGMTPAKLHELLVASEQGDVVAMYDLFSDMEERDSHIDAEMHKRRRAVTRLAWNIVPPQDASSGEKDDAKRLKELIQGIDELDLALFDLTDATGKGFSPVEIEWDFSDRTWLPKSLTFRPQSWFRFHRAYRQEIRLRDNSPEGAPLQPFGWITHVHKARSGYMERANLFRVLTWPYLFRNYSVGYMAEFLELYGIPVRIGRHPDSASEKDKVTLMRALVSIGRRAAGIMPNTMQVDLHDAVTGDPDPYMAMIAWAERSVSKSILGGTLTSQADATSNTNALGKVHDEVRKEVRDDDAAKLSDTITRDLLYPIAALNGIARNGLRRLPRFVIDTTEIRDIHQYADSLPKLVNVGMQIPTSWAHAEMGIPEPEGDEPVLQPAAAQVPSFAALRSQTRQPRVQSDLEAAVEIAERAADPMMTAWVERVRQLLEESSSLEEFRDRLIELDLPTEQLAELMRDMRVTAFLAGADEIMRRRR